VSVAELKTRLRLEHDLDDDYLARLIMAARLYVEGICGLSLLTQDLQLSLPTSEIYHGVVRLPRAPVAQILSVAVRLDGGMETLDATQYQLDNVSKPCRLMFAGEGRFLHQLQHAKLEIGFRAGFGALPDVPDDLVLAVLSLVANWYENGEGETPENVVRLLSTHRGVRL
jgi:uncharacterized phiE125 gp8 family phage protein